MSMVLLALYQPQLLGKTWHKHRQQQARSSPNWRAGSGSGHFGTFRCGPCSLSSRAPLGTITRGGPNRRSGRFRCIHAQANLPQHIGPDSSNTGKVSSGTNGSLFKFPWPLLLSVALACFAFRWVSASSTTQHHITTGQAAAAVVSQSPQPSTLMQCPPGMAGQSPAFASISAAGFAKLFSGAQRAHLAQMLVYQAQRVSLLLDLALYDSLVLSVGAVMRLRMGFVIDP